MRSNRKDATIEDMHKKKWHVKDLANVQARTDAQHLMFRAAEEDLNMIASGTAGTGKTYLAMYLGLRAVLNEQSPYKKLRIVRSAVDTRDIGFKPGTEAEKVSGYEAPYRSICSELIGRWSTYDDMKDAHLIDFTVTSDIRGSTWNNTIVVMDELANFNFHEIDTVVTRAGKNTRIIMTGDVKQTDLLKSNRDKSGMPQLIKVHEKLKTFKMITFKKEDIVRSALVREWIEAVEDTEW